MTAAEILAARLPNRLWPWIPFPRIAAQRGQRLGSIRIYCSGKLTGPYRISQQALPHADTESFARALIAAAPHQVLWGSDWPHVHIKTPMPNDADICDLLTSWVPSETQRKQVLVDNPARLYGFG